MCGGGGGSLGSNLQAQQAADEARQREAERAAQIARGRRMVNDLFDRGTVNPADPNAPRGQAFNNAFYDKYRQANLGYYTPLLERQYGDAREEMAYALARAGLTRSTVAADKQGDLNRDFQEERGAIANRAEEGVNRLKTDVEAQRAALLTQLEVANDPVAAANGATARVSALQSRPVEYSPLGDIFAGASQGIGGFITGLRERRLLDAVSATAAPSGVRGASRTVG